MGDVINLSEFRDRFVEKVANEKYLLGLVNRAIDVDTKAASPESNTEANQADMRRLQQEIDALSDEEKLKFFDMYKEEIEHPEFPEPPSA